MNAYEFPIAFGEMMIENTLKAVQAFGLASEQGDKVARMALDNAKTAREQGLQVATKWAEMARENQRQSANLFNSSVKMSVDTYRTYNQQTVEELGKQVERLTKQIEAMAPKVGMN